MLIFLKPLQFIFIHHLYLLSHCAQVCFFSPAKLTGNVSYCVLHRVDNDAQLLLPLVFHYYIYSLVSELEEKVLFTLYCLLLLIPHFPLGFHFLSSLWYQQIILIISLPNLFRYTNNS